jgi:hypothetical protein
VYTPIPITRRMRMSTTCLHLGLLLLSNCCHLLCGNALARKVNNAVHARESGRPAHDLHLKQTCKSRKQQRQHPAASIIRRSHCWHCLRPAFQGLASSRLHASPICGPRFPHALFVCLVAARTRPTAAGSTHPARTAQCVCQARRHQAVPRAASTAFQWLRPWPLHKIQNTLLLFSKIKNLMKA